MESVGFSDENKRKRLSEYVKNVGGENVGGEHGEGEDAGGKKIPGTGNSVDIGGITVDSAPVKRRRKRCLLAIPADGYTWTKYGQKKLRGKTHMRNYYRCALFKDLKCLCKRTINFDPQNPKYMSLQYTGEHNHNSVPAWDTVEDVSKNIKIENDSKLPSNKTFEFEKFENCRDFVSEVDTDSIVVEESWTEIEIMEFQNVDIGKEEEKVNEFNNLNTEDLEDLEDLDLELPKLPNESEGESIWGLAENNVPWTPALGTSENDYFDTFETLPTIPTEWGEVEIGTQKNETSVILKKNDILETEKSTKEIKNDLVEHEKDLFLGVVLNLDEMISLLKSKSGNLQKNENSECANESKFIDTSDANLKCQIENLLPTPTNVLKNPHGSVNNILMPSLVPHLEKSAISVESNGGDDIITESSSCTSISVPDLVGTGGVSRSPSYGSFESTKSGLSMDPISFLGGGDSLRVKDFMDHQLFLEEV